jgi:cytochrome c5
MKISNHWSTLAYSTGILAITLLLPMQVNADTGKATYDKACVACHKTGLMGAPKLGDKKDWKSRIAQGNATLHEHALKGFKGKKGIMPPKGGRADIPDADIKAAVDYMVSQGK